MTFNRILYLVSKKCTHALAGLQIAGLIAAEQCGSYLRQSSSEHDGQRSVYISQRCAMQCMLYYVNTEVFNTKRTHAVVSSTFSNSSLHRRDIDKTVGFVDYSSPGMGRDIYSQKWSTKFPEIDISGCQGHCYWTSSATPIAAELHYRRKRIFFRIR